MTKEGHYSDCVEGLVCHCAVEHQGGPYKTRKVTAQRRESLRKLHAEPLDKINTPVGGYFLAGVFFWVRNKILFYGNIFHLYKHIHLRNTYYT